MTNKATVLVVEDDVDIASLLNFMLTREGFNVVITEDGQQASKTMDSMEPPDLVLLDLMLPYIDGFELYSRMRTKPSWQRVPVVILSAKTQGAVIVKALDSGVADYIIKPFQPEELISRVKRLLKIQSAA